MNVREFNNAFQIQSSNKMTVFAKIYFIFVFFIFSGVVQAKSSSDYTYMPPTLGDTTTPLIMLALSNDHQLHFKAFTDWDDLDGDGIVDVGYTHSVNYEGYFDHGVCYTYSRTENVFVPQELTSDRYCNKGIRGQWSGNFLNWATMTRIDQVRKILYGGYRSTDGADGTILERSFLPMDVHSFAKYYNGTDLGKLTPFSNVSTGNDADMDSGLTICNTSNGYAPGVDTHSSRSTAPPLMRVVPGNYSLWASNTGEQCRYREEANWQNLNNPNDTGIFAHPSSPSRDDRAVEPGRSSAVPDYIVRVEVCKEGLISDLYSNDKKLSCKKYPSGKFKPVGFLQERGDEDKFYFGLISGSYASNRDGGVLRKEIGSFSDEVNVNLDGTFTSVNGIVSTIDKFRIANYRYANNDWYFEDNCGWGLASFANGNCSNWGNPFGEILLECYRYFGGASSALNNANDNLYISGLNVDTQWSMANAETDSEPPPLTEDNACARLNVLAFNASTISFDSDLQNADLSVFPPRTKTLDGYTKLVGDTENLTGEYFVGVSGSNDNQRCTAKTISDLSTVTGTCPDAPRLEGSYHAAGLAYFARTEDVNARISGKQTVETFGVALAPAVPQILIPVPRSDKFVTIVPACHAEFDGGGNRLDQACGLADFKYIQANHEVATDTYEGSFYVLWDDSEQGGDYDLDVSGIISYRITPSNITVTTQTSYAFGSFQLGFGFIISGTDDNGMHVLSGINGYTEFNCSNCRVNDAPRSKSFGVGASSAKFLEQPLFYAAKYGGFEEVGADNQVNPIPDKQVEWDEYNNSTGVKGAPDGIPDNYFYAVNPATLRQQIDRALDNISERASSGTAAAVVTTSGSGAGAVIQALYNAKYVDDQKNSVSWVGSLNAFFLEDLGKAGSRLREDNALPKGEMTSADNIVYLEYNEDLRELRIERYQANLGDKNQVYVGSFPLDTLAPVWKAHERLSEVDNYITQRKYSDAAKGGRYIVTAFDEDKDGVVRGTETELVDFTYSKFDPGSNPQPTPDGMPLPKYRHLGLSSSEAGKVKNLINYIRGEEGIQGYRSRTVNFDNDPELEPWLLGDIVHSSPVIAGAPNDKNGYVSVYGDETYRQFMRNKSKRRNVVYVGSNDGMIHAFNAGFSEGNSFLADKHELGDELWAYIPYNLLPHLQWLPDPLYPHVSYVDGAPKLFDVNIGGEWKTILVVGMRFGGGLYQVDPDEDGDLSDAVNFRSAFVIFDVTDPESEPKLLGEFTHEKLGFTTVEPAIVKKRVGTDGTYGSLKDNEWYLVFGSGPAGSNDVAQAKALREGVSDQDAYVFMLNLNNMELTASTPLSTGETNSFVGGMHSTDWNRDFVDDVVYFGTVGGTPEFPTGSLRRFRPFATGSSAISKLINVDYQAFSAAPVTYTDVSGDNWIYSGTGRLYTAEDNLYLYQNSFYGIKEPKDSDGTHSFTTVKYVPTSQSATELLDTTDIVTNGFALGRRGISSGTAEDHDVGMSAPAKSFDDVVSAVKQKKGWMYNYVGGLDEVGQSDGAPNKYRRSIESPEINHSSGTLVYLTYDVSTEKCSPEGRGTIYAPDLVAGIGARVSPLGIGKRGIKDNAGDEQLLFLPAKRISGHGDEGFAGLGSLEGGLIQTSTGELFFPKFFGRDVSGIRRSWREIPVDWDWE